MVPLIHILTPPYSSTLTVSILFNLAVATPVGTVVRAVIGSNVLAVTLSSYSVPFSMLKSRGGSMYFFLSASKGIVVLLPVLRLIRVMVAFLTVSYAL